MGNHTTTYVLVHGAWHGSWCWKRVRAALQYAGHNVFTPTLTGLGERSRLNSPAIDLSTHIADIVNLIQWKELSDVVLCGHSYAGCVITGVADQIPDRIRALIFQDAFVPENGVFDGYCAIGGSASYTRSGRRYRRMLEDKSYSSASIGSSRLPRRCML